MGALVKAGRVSRTVIKPEPGFRAELPGLDLPTLIQMTCARRERLVVRVSSYGEEGFLYSADCRLMHATIGDLVGDEAVLRMLAWPTGEFSICERPFPLHPTIETSTEGLLLRAAQRSDEAAHEGKAAMEFDDDVGLAEQLEGEEDTFGVAEDEPLPPPYAAYAPLPELNLPRDPQHSGPEIELVLESSDPPPRRRPSVPPPPPPSARPAPPVAWPFDAPPAHATEARIADQTPAAPSSTVVAKPQSAKPQSAKPQSAKPQSAKPQSAKPQSAKPQSWPIDPSPVPTLASLLQARPRNEEELPALPTPTPRRLDPTPARDAIPPPRTSSTQRPPTPPNGTARATFARPSSAPAPVPGRSSRPPAPDALPPVSLGRISEPPRRPSQPPLEVGRVNVSRPIAGTPSVARRLPPPPLPTRRLSIPADDSSVLASVRIDARGALVGTFGGDDQFPQLLAYVSRIAALVQADFALDPFEALHAELAGKRVLIYQDFDELVGVVMKPSGAAQELRQRLGV